MAEPTKIYFPYVRDASEQRLDDVAFGRACVTRAFRALDPDALGFAIEALARAVNAEGVAKSAVPFAPMDGVTALGAFERGGARG